MAIECKLYVKFIFDLLLAKYSVLFLTNINTYLRLTLVSCNRHKDVSKYFNGFDLICLFYEKNITKHLH